MTYSHPLAVLLLAFANHAAIAGHVNSSGPSTPEASWGLVENAGQWDSPARFVGRFPGGSVRLVPGAIELQLWSTEGSSALVRLVVEGGREDCLPEGEGRLEVTRNYLVGDASRWRSGVASFASAIYRDVRPGIDLRVREEGGHLEYDLLLAAGASCDDLVLRCEGADGLALADDGALVLETGVGPVRMSPPRSWMESAEGGRDELASGYRLVDEARFGFLLPGRDERLPAVIDPGITWLTYLGGDAWEAIFGLAQAPDGNLIVAGSTLSNPFDTTAGAFQVSDPDAGAFHDGYVAIMDPTGSSLIACTYFGGGEVDGINGIAVHPGGEVSIVGHTKSLDLPTSPGALQGSKGIGWDGFVATLSRDLTTLLYGTYLGDPGGGSRDWACAVDVHAAGLLTVGGYAQSKNFHITAGSFQTTNAGKKDVFVTRLDPSKAGAAQLVWSTFLGGANEEGGGSLPPSPDATVTLDLLVDSSGVATVMGMTGSPDFPTTAGSYQPTYKGTGDAFVARLDPTLPGTSQLVWSTFLGGSDTEFTSALVVDSGGTVAVCGNTASTNFPTTAGAYLPTKVGGTYDGFVAQLDPALTGSSQLLWSTHIGGSGLETALGLGVEPGGAVVTSGWTGSLDFPTTADASSPTFLGGGSDAWAVRFDPSLSGSAQLLYATFAGGLGSDTFGMVLPVGPGKSLLAGSTTSSGLATPGAYDTTHNGDRDVWVAHFAFPAEAQVYCTAGTSASGCPASLSAVGVPSATAPTGFELEASGVEGAKDGLFFFGANGRQANPWGNGSSFQCVVPPVKRAGLLNGSGSAGLCDGAFLQDLNARWCPTCSKPAHNPGAGTTVQAQLWYRDPLNTSNQTTSLSDAIEFVVEP
jgi:hypothetical protein